MIRYGRFPLSKLTHSETFFIEYDTFFHRLPLCSLDSVELAVVEDEFEEPSVDEAVVELLVEDLVSSLLPRA